MRILGQVVLSDRITDHIGGHHTRVYLGVRFHVLVQQVEQHVGALRMAGQDKGTAVVFVLKIVVKGCEHIHLRHTVQQGVLLVMGQAQAVSRVGLSIIGRVDIGRRLKNAGLLSQHFGRSLAQGGVVNSADVGLIHVFLMPCCRVQIKDIHRLIRRLRHRQPVRRRRVIRRGFLIFGLPGNTARQQDTHQQKGCQQQSSDILSCFHGFSSRLKADFYFILFFHYTMTPYTKQPYSILF
ncbi:hypothetical protein SDC9_130828 [bioreactor metagenome]|uniref:Uncharacterized protein n=1 Tax=bioreactor metagenome TaxID=1076179 RepID=A0A645D3I5_9ZZZZ